MPLSDAEYHERMANRRASAQNATRLDAARIVAQAKTDEAKAIRSLCAAVEGLEAKLDLILDRLTPPPENDE